MNFSQGHSGTKVRYVNRACFPKEKHQNSHKKRAKFMNFSFCPFLWFGLPGRLLTREGVDGQRGLARGDPPFARDSDLFLCPFSYAALRKRGHNLSGLPNANAKSLRFSYAISKIAPLPPVAALNRNSNSQIAPRYAAFWHAISKIALASFL